MAATSKKTNGLPRNTGFSAPMDLGNVAEINYTAMNAATTLGQRWFEMTSEINAEMARFINTRLKEDVTVPSGLANCKTSEEMFELYSGFFRKAVSQYFDEAERLAHIGSDFVGKATKVVEEESRDVHNLAD